MELRCRCPSIFCQVHVSVDCGCQECEYGWDPIIVKLHLLTRRAALARKTPRPPSGAPPPPPHWSENE